MSAKHPIESLQALWHLLSAPCVFPQCHYHNHNHHHHLLLLLLINSLVAHAAARTRKKYVRNFPQKWLRLFMWCGLCFFLCCWETDFFQLSPTAVANRQHVDLVVYLPSFLQCRKWWTWLEPHHSRSYLTTQWVTDCVFSRNSLDLASPLLTFLLNHEKFCGTRYKLLLMIVFVVVMMFSNLVLQQGDQVKCCE